MTHNINKHDSSHIQVYNLNLFLLILLAFTDEDTLSYSLFKYIILLALTAYSASDVTAFILWSSSSLSNVIIVTWFLTANSMCDLCLHGFA